MSRYPYTVACDLIREWASSDDREPKLSRAEASIIRSRIANIIGMDDAELARKLADYAIAQNASAEPEKSEAPTFG